MTAAEQRFDDDWFIARRPALLRPWAARETARFRTVEALRAASARGDSRRDEHAHFELALSRLAPRHAIAARAHAQFYCACLESLALVPADAMVRAALEIEWFWYTSPFKAFYRDHLAHVMKVALLAGDLVRADAGPLVRDGEPGIVWIARDLASGRLGSRALRRAARRAGCSESDLVTDGFWREALLEALKTAGLLHDLAYPSQMASKVRHVSAPADPFAAFALTSEPAVTRTLRLLDDTLVGTPFTRGDLRPLEDDERDVARRLLGRSHSLQAGAYILERSRESERTWRLSPQEAFTLEWAALAASLHDYDKVYEERPGSGRGDGQADPELRAWLRNADNRAAVRPTFKHDPASYLLALADQLQDFGRLNFERAPANPEGTDAVTLALRYPWRAVSLRAHDGAATVTFELAPDAAGSCFACAGAGARASLATRKRADAAKIFVDGWLDHEGLFASVAVECKP